jgi:Scaffold protein Nfu/NifU N terminal
VSTHVHEHVYRETMVKSQRTPNPNAMKFTLDRRVVEGKSSKTFNNSQSASGDPIAERLFALNGVNSVFMVEDFVTVTKDNSADWDTLTPRVIAVLEEVLG